MGFEYLQYDSLKYAFTKLRSLEGTARKRVASLGYLETSLSIEQARKIVGEDKLPSLQLNGTYFRNRFGISALPLECAGRALSAQDREHYGIDKEVDSVGDVDSIRYRRLVGLDLLPFETFSVFTAMDCEYQPFDIAPFFGVETIVDLNKPIGRDFYGLFDLVLEGGTTEHCLSPATVLANVMYMLKTGGIALHFVPQHMSSHGFYNFDPLFFVELYQANGFKILDQFTYLYGDTTPYTIPWSNSPTSAVDVPALPSQLCIMARKEREVEEVRKPTQKMYSIYTRMAQTYTYGPLLDNEKTIPAPARTGDSVYDAVMQHLACVCEPEELAAIQADPEYKADPYQLSPVLEKYLLRATERRIEAAAKRLAGREAYFWIIEPSLYKKWQSAFAAVKPLGAVSYDPAIDGTGIIDPNGLPLVSIHTVCALRPAVPLVVFADRRHITGVARMVCELTPDIDLDVVACWR